MTEQELIEQMARLLAVRFVYEHDSNDYPFNYDGLSEAGKERAIRDATQLFHLVKQANYVRLADDQSLPENPYDINTTSPLAHMEYSDEDFAKYHTYPEAQQDMLKAGFKKVME